VWLHSQLQHPVSPYFLNSHLLSSTSAPFIKSLFSFPIFRRHLTKHTNKKATSLNNPTKSQSLNRPLDRKNSLGSPARPATINQGERIPVSYLDTNLELRRLHSSVGFVTPAARAWQQQESNKAKNDNVLSISLVPFGMVFNPYLVNRAQLPS